MTTLVLDAGALIALDRNDRSVWAMQVPLDGPLARATGLLCAQAGTADIVDASVALIAGARSRSGPVGLVTSDPDDLGHLLRALNAPVHVPV